MMNKNQLLKEKTKHSVISGFCVLAIGVSGCATQPSRSQTQNFDHCVFLISGGEGVASVPYGRDCLTQVMTIRTDGNETNSQTTTMPDTKLMIPLGDGSSIAVSAASALAAKAASAGETQKKSESSSDE